MSERYENFHPREVYRCLCLMHLANEIYDADSLSGENKTSCMIMCQAHFVITLLSETKYECTSQSDNDFLVIPLQKRYCKSFIRHYWENMSKLYSFKSS